MIYPFDEWSSLVRLHERVLLCAVFDRRLNGERLGLLINYSRVDSLLRKNGSVL